MMKEYVPHQGAEEEYAELKIQETNDNEILRLAKHGLHITIPWHREVIRLGTTIHINRLSTNTPWSETNPFILSDLYMITKLFQAENGTTSDFKSVKTSRECETGDHLTLGFGMGVGLPFVASVSVKGTYDRDVQENTDVSILSFGFSFSKNIVQSMTLRSWTSTQYLHSNFAFTQIR